MRARIIRSTDSSPQELGVMKFKNMLDDPDWPYSINWIERTDDESREGLEPDQTVSFYMLKGHGSVVVDGSEWSIAEGDLIAFPPVVRWIFRKGVTLLAVSSPPYDRSKRQYL